MGIMYLLMSVHTRAVLRIQRAGGLLENIHIQKRLIDGWKHPPTCRFFCKHFRLWPNCYSYTLYLCSLLTISLKPCLIRGLIAAVKLSFASGDRNVKDEAHVSPCSLENFLSQWNIMVGSYPSLVPWFNAGRCHTRNCLYSVFRQIV